MIKILGLAVVLFVSACRKPPEPEWRGLPPSGWRACAWSNQVATCIHTSDVHGSASYTCLASDWHQYRPIGVVTCVRTSPVVPPEAP